MRKQYRIDSRHEGEDIYRTTLLYHDGKLVDSVEHKDLVPIYAPDHCHFIEKIKKEGYTYGYTEEDLKTARERYFQVAHNQINVNEKTNEVLDMEKRLVDMLLETYLEHAGFVFYFTEEEAKMLAKDLMSRGCILQNQEPYEIKVQEKIFPRCDKCVRWRTCSRTRDNENTCPDYKYDPPDGGYYG